MRMRRLTAWLLLSIACALPSPKAEAQSGEMPLTVTAIDGPGWGEDRRRVRQEDIARGVNFVDCENASDTWIEFTLAPGSVTVQALDLWIGVGAETCQSSSSRTPPSETCQRVGYIQLGGSTGSAPDPDENNVVAIGLDAVLAAGEYSFCDFGAAVSTVNFFFVADNENFRGDVGTIEANHWRILPVKFDAGPPNAPTFKDGDYAGDREVVVEWNPVTAGGSETTRYRVYVEPRGCDGGSGTLVGGGRPPIDVTEAFTRSERITGTSFAVRLSNLGLEIGESAAVYVTAMDEAYNESNLSEPICVTRVPTAGFCAAYEAAEGEPCPSSCSTVGGSPSSVLWLSAFLGLVAVYTHRRRFAR